MTTNASAAVWLRYTWRAGSDRIAHAIPVRPRSRSRTACGLKVTDESHAWPERSRCLVCLASLDLNTADTEGAAVQQAAVQAGTRVLHVLQGVAAAGQSPMAPRLWVATRGSFRPTLPDGPAHLKRSLSR